MAVHETSGTVWNDALLANPHAAADKRARVQRMFAAIAGSYDLNNRLHSLWMDQRWRRKAVRLAEVRPTDVVVDVACGTGDLSLLFAGTPARRVIGIDFTFEMLPIARGKAASARRPSPAFINGDALTLPLCNACADVVSISFGLRNLADPTGALREFHRVLRPAGRLIILEFSLPENRVFRRLYNFYFRKVLPRTATWISGDKSGAYRYLPESVNTFVQRGQIMDMMRQAGFTQVQQHPLTFGVCVCYRAMR